MSLADGASQTAPEDVRRRFPDWEIAIDRDFTGRCFGYRRSGGATLSGQDPLTCRTGSLTG